MRTRFFNSIDIDYKNKTLTKKSINQDKLKYEVNFYKSANSVFNGMMPELVEYSDDYSSYTVRYISGDELGELYSLDKSSVRQLASVFKITGAILGDFNNSLDKVSPEFLHKIFIDKAIERSEKLKNTSLGDIFFSGTVLNGRPYPPLVDLLTKCGELIKNLDARQIVLHGDMCFSNILIESGTGNLFFIDPRGGFESASIYGPAVYDVAKLAQSVFGLYDSITNNQYLLSNSPDGYTLRIYTPMFYKIAEKKFMDAVHAFDLDAKDLRTLAGVMLAGAPIFHIDDESRAMAIALRAVELLG